jgi:hypothetical protein
MAAARVGRRVAFAFAAFFLLPALASAAWWSFADRPQGWRQADWSSSGLLPRASENREASIHVLSARTGGLKGALALHSWIVVKRAGGEYERYDKVGWGSPIRRNAYAPDGRWYSNEPFVVHAVHGAMAQELIPAIEAAIASYPHSRPGDYRIWPGPNSNSFIAHVLRETPQLGAVLPPNAVGRDYLSGGRYVAAGAGGVSLSLGGYAGISAGPAPGIEINLLGLVAGVDFLPPAVKLPGIGRLGL